MDYIPFLSNCFVRKNDKNQNGENERDIQFNKGIFNWKINGKLSEDEEISSAGTLESGGTLKVSRKNRSLLASKFTSAEDSGKPFAGKIDSTDDSVNGDGMELIDNMKHKVYSTGEWLKVLKNNDLDNTSITELIHSLRHGIPDELRPAIWEFLTKLDSLRSQYPKDYYETLKNKPSTSDSQIKKDVNRTFPTHPFFQNKDKQAETFLFNIMRAYANHDTEIGYTQGMNYIVGKLLIILDPDNYRGSELDYFKTYEQDYEEKVFWLFIHITYVKNWRQVFRSNFPKMHGLISTLDARLKAKAPEVHNAIINSQFDTLNCFHAIFICLLLDCAPVPMAKRLLDLFFIEEEKIVFRVLIRVVILCKKEILEASENETLHKFLKHEMMEKCYEKYRENLYFMFPGMESTD